MEHLRSEPFQLGSSIGRPHLSNSNPAAPSFEGRDDIADQRGDCADPTQFTKPSLKSAHTSSANSNMADVSKKFHQLVVKGGAGGVTKATNTAAASGGAYGDISRTISQDTAETSALSIASELTSGTAYTSGTAGTDATLDAAISASRDRGNAILELSTIEEDSICGGAGSGGSGITDTPGGKSNAATAGNDAYTGNVDENDNDNTNSNIMDINTDVRANFPSFLSTLPPTWSGSSLSFIKFLLFVKESDESFIPEMDRMLADYDRLVTGLQKENTDLKTKLKTEIGSLKKRIHDKKKLVQKLTKKLTECQGYITELTDELERIYRENKGTIAPSTRAATLAASRPASDDITVATATSEITMEQSLHHHSIEATLTRMLAEERSRAETLADLNKSLQDDLADTRREVEEMERKLDQSDKSRSAMETTVQSQWQKVQALIEENRTLHEDLAGVVIELSDAQEEFSEREAQLIRMVEEGGGYGGYGEEEDSMEVDGANTHDLEANIAVLQEELEVAKRVMESIKYREQESSHRAGDLLIRNETLRTKQDVMEEMHKKEMAGMAGEMNRLRRENADIRKAMQQNESMVSFARQIVSSNQGNGMAPSANFSSSASSAKVAALERELSLLRRDQEYKADKTVKCLREALVFLYDFAAGTTSQDPSSLIATIRETSQMLS